MARARSAEAQLKFSEAAFRDIVWPYIGPMVGGGELRTLESGDHTRGGIDAYTVLRNGVRTIAQRTQRIDDYDKPSTFTIRFKRTAGGTTEWDKRIAAYEVGNDLPALTVQAYVHEASRTFVKAAVVHTLPFYAWCNKNRHLLEEHRNRDDGNGFYSVQWADIMRHGEVPIATRDRICCTRAPREFFAGWPPWELDATPGGRYI